MARDVADFLSRFALPLVAGGEVAIGKPIGGAEFEEMSRNLAHASVPIVAIDEARTEVVSTLVVRPPSFVFDVDELALVASVHNLLFLAHPRADGWMVTDSAKRRVLEGAYAFASRPLTTSRVRNLARHGLLHNLFDLSRKDVTLRWWTGSAAFVGQAPPTRLRRWQSVRRVREEVEVASFQDLLGEPEIAPVLITLLRRSPITQLFTIDQDGPRLHWEDAAFLLRDAEICRAIAYKTVAGDQNISGGSPESKVARPARMAAAFDQMLERAPSEADVRTVTAFLIYLATLLALAEVDESPRSKRRGAQRVSPLLSAVLSADKAGARPRGLATFFALPTAAAMIDPIFSEVPGVSEEPALGSVWRAHCRQAKAGLGDGVIASLAERMRRHVRPLLAAAPATTENLDPPAGAGQSHLDDHPSDEIVEEIEAEVFEDTNPGIGQVGPT